MWSADLAPCAYFQRTNPSEKLLGVGWLEGDQPYPTGSVSPKVRNRVAEMLWTQEYHFPVSFMGYHQCTLCDADHRMQAPVMAYHGIQTRVGLANLWIPGRSATYVAPSLILHYMVAHGYTPPEEFCEALLACPPIGSEAYYRALEGKVPPWLEGWVARRGVDLRDMPWRADGGDIAQYRSKGGEVFEPEVEFSTPAGARLAGSTQLRALAAQIREIAQPVCARLAYPYLQAIVALRAAPGAPATVSLDFFSDADPELGARIEALLPGAWPALDVDEPTHIRLHFTIRATRETIAIGPQLVGPQAASAA